MAQMNPDSLPDQRSKGNVTYYKRNGQTIVRVKGRAKGSGERTTLVMNQRTRCRNVQHAWRKFSNHIAGFFEDRKAGQTAYNKFMSVNLPHAMVYMPREPRIEGCVLDHFTISSGPLEPPLTVTPSPQGHVSSLTIGDLQIDENTLVGDFLMALGHLPQGLRSFDINLHFFRVNQKVYDALHQCSLDIRHWCLQGRGHDQRPLLSVLGLDSTDDGLLNIDGHLGAVQQEGYMVAWVISRPTFDGRTLVTTQRLEGKNPLLDHYSSQMARYDAIYSYSGVRKSYAMPFRYDDTHNGIQFAPESFSAEGYKTSAFNVHVSALVRPTPEAGTVEGRGLYPMGTSVTLKAVAAEGYRFLCWDDGCLDAERTLNPTTNITLAAIFAPLEP